MSHSITSFNSTTASLSVCPFCHQPLHADPTKFATTMGAQERPMRSPGALYLRYRLQIRRSGPKAETIAAILARHGGVCLNPEAAKIYEFPSEAAYDAALTAVRSVYGWTSIERRY
jgi:hypothetical protein